MTNIVLRPYQKECVDLIAAQSSGSHLVQMATGLGKTVTFASIPRQGRVLLLSHREELVNQPRRYFDCSYGVEQGNQHAHGEEVVSASVQSIRRRLNRFTSNEFDTIIVDEAHHAAAKSYADVLEHFEPRMVLGFTATPSRGDSVGLHHVFDDILFSRDLKWGIDQGYLCKIHALRAHIGYDLSGVRTHAGDYAPGELNERMRGTATAIAQAYRDYAKGATLIFATSVEHAEAIADEIPGAVVVTGATKKRADIIRRFSEREIPCLVNCMVFTEGTDIPLVETIIIARPTKSSTLYAQMVGRGLRLHPDKDELTLIDCVGVTSRSSKVQLCTAPTLIGIDPAKIPEARQDDLQGDLLEMPMLAEAAMDCPDAWIKSVEVVDLWARGTGYDTHGVNYVRLPDGAMVVQLKDNRRMRIPPADHLGMVRLGANDMISMQQALDRVYLALVQNFPDQRALWDLNIVTMWGNTPATEKQINMIRWKCNGYTPPAGLSKMQASAIINHVMAGRQHA